ncbi:hypothetical protein ACFY7H_13080 [Streptomyces sp. NPDC012794]|uniref:hypothetical protein n=1 Tax=Streptomyces sp. NPDC012794 TaxID=3364850 RepID=UPI003690D5FC
MSKLGKKVSRKLDQAAHVFVSAGYRRGSVSMAVANNASRLLLGRDWERCDAGTDCPIPEHEHYDLP